VIATGLAEQYGVRPIGCVEEIRERFYAITTERRLKHPAVTAISKTFGESCSRVHESGGGASDQRRYRRRHALRDPDDRNAGLHVVVHLA